MAFTKQTNPGLYSIPMAPSFNGSTAAVIPGLEMKSSSAQIANSANLDIDIPCSCNPVFDVSVFSDRALTLTIMVQAISGGTFRQQGAPISIPASQMTVPVNGRRIAGAATRLRFSNASGADTTTCEINVTSRGMG